MRGEGFGVVVRYALGLVGQLPRCTTVSSLPDAGDILLMRESLDEGVVAFGGRSGQLADNLSKGTAAGCEAVEEQKEKEANHIHLLRPRLIPNTNLTPIKPCAAVDQISQIPIHDGQERRDAAGISGRRNPPDKCMSNNCSPPESLPSRSK